MYTNLSRYLSYLLRHCPEDLDLFMDNKGWVNVLELIEKINLKSKYHINVNILKEIVRTDSKGRYSFSDDGLLIRANQGHSIDRIDMKYEPVMPPEVLYHGTSIKNYDFIKQDGIKPMSRQYVHLSEDIDTAYKVGERHGKPIVLLIDSKRMYQDGIEFYKSENNVWLTKFVDSIYLLSESD